jgi:hypothetical protein
MPTERFKSRAAYRRWTAYRHIHGIKAPGLKRVCIRGHGCHAVKHAKRGKPKRAGKRT